MSLTDRLQRLLVALEAIGAPFVVNVRPGLSQAEVLAVLEEHGPALATEQPPAEYFDWFAWNNGFDPDIGALQGMRLCGLEQAVRVLQQRIESLPPEYLGGPLLPIAVSDSGGIFTIRRATGESVWHLGYLPKDGPPWEPLDKTNTGWSPARTGTADEPVTLAEWVDALLHGLSTGAVTVGQYGYVGGPLT